tara:strand:- start:3371 stop:3496 length:126 start_codon:yes stop_codon:yes gene_type:complete
MKKLRMFSTRLTFQLELSERKIYDSKSLASVSQASGQLNRR